MNLNCPYHLLVLLFGLFIATQSIAAPIELESDEASYNHKKGTSVYRGNVKLVYGDMTLRGEEVQVFSSDGEVTRIISVAKPSRFIQHNEKGVVSVRAEAGKIEYRVSEDLIELIGDVKIQDHDKTFFGERAIYNTRTKTFSSNPQQSRIKLILQPKSKRSPK